jgi:hypothetical protein
MQIRFEEFAAVLQRFFISWTGIEKHFLDCGDDELQRAFNFVQMLDREKTEINSELLICKVLKKLAIDDASDEETMTDAQYISESGMELFLQYLLRNSDQPVHNLGEKFELDASSLPLLFPLLYEYFTTLPTSP